MPICKAEVYDADIMEGLLRHAGVCEQDKTSLRRYKKRRVNGNTVQIIYDYSDGPARQMLKGRLYPDPFLGLATFPREIRAALAQKYYDEIDMENSQPVLLAQIGRKEGIQTAALDEYVEQRASVLETIQKSHKMTRSEAKDICIAVLFGGVREEHPLLPRMKVELDLLARIVCDKYPDYLTLAKKSKEAKARKGNLPASALAQYAQDQETKILLIIQDFLAEKGYLMDVLQHDGGDVRKKDGQTIPLTLLKEAEGVVSEKTGFKVTLTVKPLTHSFDFTPASNETFIPNNIHINDSWAAERLVDAVGDRLRMVGNDLYCEGDDGIWESGDWGIRVLIEQHEKQLIWKQLNEAGLTTVFDYGGNVVNIAKLIKQAYIKAKPGKLPLQMLYTRTPKDCLDEDVAAEAVRVFKDLLFLITGKQEPLRDYVTKWLAHILQHPYELAGILLILSGGKGVGKDTLIDFLIAHVFGKHGATNYTTNRQFFEKHDTGRKGKLLIKLEEADRKMCLDNASDLKAMVTGESATFNPKNEKAVTIPNYCRFIFTTNKPNPVDFSDGERRFVILTCSAEKKGDMDYWTMVRAKLFNNEAGLAVANYLLSIDLSEFQVRTLPPNEYQDAVTETEIKSEQRFVSKWDGKETLASVLFNEYRDYCRDGSIYYVDNANAFGRLLLPFIGDGSVVKKRKADGVWYKKANV